jgi:ABC-type transport system involved in cytochrome bd biosynthesis fused ATPase/permease subunit
MKEFENSDVFTMPAMAIGYTKKTYAANFSMKWLPAGLVALVTDLADVFTELFFIIVLLWFGDLVIGVARAWHDQEKEIDWTKMMGSILKLLVICIGVVSVHLIEHLILNATGIDTQMKLCVATLIVIGSAEAFSIVDNLCYFFPQMGDVAKRIKDLLGKARNNDGTDQ